MEKDALGAHARDEIGITDALAARPLQAAVASAFSFLMGGIIPLLAAILAPKAMLIMIITIISLSFLAILGAIAAYTGGASVQRGAIRVFVWGALVLAVTGLAGKLFGILV